VRRAFWKRWLLLGPLTLALIAYPVSNTILRVAVIVCVLLLAGGLVAFNWRARWLRILAASVATVFLLFLLLPGRRVSVDSLRRSYLASLRGYEGTRYVWGGENQLGIDCSGLVRKSLVNSLVAEGLGTLNPSLLRKGVSLWWQDCSARALGERHRQLTTQVLDADAINQVDHAQIQAGDFAVTVDGVHVLAYLGGLEWIEADPDARKVLRLTAPSTNSWFDAPVRIMRWQQFNEGAPDQTR